MTVNVEGLNYFVIHNCDDLNYGTDCSADASTNDTGDFKEGTASLYWVCNATGEGGTFTPAAALDLTGKHVRFWGLFTQGGFLENTSDGGIQFWATGGGNTGKWYIDGLDTYSGGWKNYVVDIESTVDEGTQPTASDVTALGVEVHLNGASKNVPNTWVDNLCYGDGLIVYGDADSDYMDFEDIYQKDNSATDGGFGVITKYGGQYFCTGELQFGTSSDDKYLFKALSQVLVFEDRAVSSDLMGITVLSSSDSEFMLGDRSGNAGIQGCIVRSASPDQTAKFFFNAGDSDIETFGLYGTTVADAEVVTLPPVNSTDVQVLNSAFEAGGEVDINLTEIQNTNFIAADVGDAAARIETSDHNMTDVNFIACPIGTNYTVGGTYTVDGHVYSNCSDDIEFSAANTDTKLVLNATGGANPSTYVLTGDSDLTSDDIEINNPIFHTLTGVIEASEVTYIKLDNTELYHVESTATDGQVQYQYNYTSDIPIEILITSLSYENMVIETTLTQDDASIPVSQSSDPNYYNP